MATSTRKKTARRKRHPYRRGVWSAILFFLALFTLAGQFHLEAVWLDWIAEWFRGLFGYGYWIASPALFWASWILFAHHGRPIQRKVACALGIPVAAGALVHTLFSGVSRDGGLSSFLSRLWYTGQAMESGGALSGSIGSAAAALVSPPIAVIVFLASLSALLMGAAGETPASLIRAYRARPRYEPEPYETSPRRWRGKPRPASGGKSSGGRSSGGADPDRPVSLPSLFSRRAESEIPPDDAPLPDGRESKRRVRGGFPGFWKRKPSTAAGIDAASGADTEGGQATADPESPDVETAESYARGGKSEGRAAEERSESGEPTRGGTSGKRKRKGREDSVPASEIAQEIGNAPSAGENAYRIPPLSLLEENHLHVGTETKAELDENARRLEETLRSFGVNAKSDGRIHGPAVTRYDFQLEQGVKLSKITNLSDDIALALGSTGVRIAPIPTKKSVVGIEVPNRQVKPVLIRDVVESPEFQNHKSTTAFALGKDISGTTIVGSVERLPHVLIAGTTGSGKSVCMNCLIISLLYRSTPEQVRFIMVDPKMVELAPYNGIPHLLIPVVTDPKKAAGALQWAVGEMMKRYKTFSENGVKKLEEYNRTAQKYPEKEPMPSVVVVIDELADLMLVAAKEVEESIMRVAQMGRAAGIHLVIATQRPSADVITGLMKANIPSRIAFAVASSIESRIILDTAGAEKLMGRGDMLYAPLGENRIRVQGCFISPEEIDRVVSHVKEANSAHYDEDVSAAIEASIQVEKDGKGGKEPEPEPEEAVDELLPAAVEVVLDTEQASVSMLQRRLKLGYSRAARLMDQMEERGYVGPFEGSHPRQIRLTKEQWQEERKRLLSGIKGSGGKRG